ncbi:MAG: CxxC-x17-CxxC domain-containing protein, partial [Patescibacteria group bacterium]
SSLLGAMIITKIQLAAMERVRIPEDERKDFYLYVDEFQNFATDSFANILSEARKYRLNLTIAHQYTAQLSNENGTAVRDAVFGNVGTMIIFRVGADDAEFIEKEFEPEFTAQDLVNLPNYHIYLKLMIDGVTSRPFSASTLPPMKIDLSAGVKEKIIESSRKLYTRPREEVEAEINRWSGMLQVGDDAAKYKADCSNCGKVTMVPFEPKEGRPVYCKDCMFKIKSGELKPQTGFVASRSARQDEKVSTAPLAALGIEFTGGPATKPVGQNVQRPTQSSGSHTPRPQANNTPNPNSNSNINTNIRTPYKPPERKHSGPSPLLRGLLEKIGVDNKKEENLPKEVTPVKVPAPAPVSLSTLKKPENNVVTHPPMPTKEASDEKKASLKDLLAKVTNPQPKVDIPKQTLENKVETKIEPVVIPKEEMPVPPPPPVQKPISNPVPPPPQPTQTTKEEVKPIVNVVPTPPKQDDINKTDTWQKKKAQKEVPEYVLRKVLE